MSNKLGLTLPYMVNSGKIDGLPHSLLRNDRHCPLDLGAIRRLPAGPPSMSADEQLYWRVERDARVLAVEIVTSASWIEPAKIVELVC